MCISHMFPVSLDNSNHFCFSQRQFTMFFVCNSLYSCSSKPPELDGPSQGSGYATGAYTESISIGPELVQILVPWRHKLHPPAKVRMAYRTAE